MVGTIQPHAVHWKFKWMSIHYKGSTAELQGMTTTVPEEIVVHVCNVIQSDLPDTSNSILPEVSIILDEFAVASGPLTS